MTVIEKTNLKELYDRDDNLWLEKTIALLKENRLNELDLENLIEELESLARRDKLAMASLLEQVIRHLLMYQYWHDERERNARHWEAEIYSFRGQIKHKLTTNLQNHLISKQQEIYRQALGYVIRKTGLSIDTFPEQCPYTLEQLLDEDWYPKIETSLQKKLSRTSLLLT